MARIDGKIIGESTGMFVGKFLPFHRGHLFAILQASTKVDKLYVVISQDRKMMKERCVSHNIKEMPLELITQWLNIEFQAFPHIIIVPVDETGTDPYPHGWVDWARLTRVALIKAGVLQRGHAPQAVAPDAVDVDYMFGSENDYDAMIRQLFNYAIEYVKIDVKREYVDISATRMVEDIYKNWEMLPGVVRPHFVKKVLITGTESCGKTTLTQMLGKNYLTSWSTEIGKDYEKEKLGGYSDNWNVIDFDKIAMLQLEQDDHAYRTANKVSFIDTDAIVTGYYLNMYLGERSELIEVLSKKEMDKWDLVVLLQPTVPWVQDGTRWEENKEDKKRWILHKQLKRKYDDLGIKYIEIGGDYHHRFNEVIKLVENMLKAVEK